MVTERRTCDIRRRPRKNEVKSERGDRRSFVYTLSVAGNTQHVCKKAFCALHGIKESRLKKKVLNVDCDIEDGRGKHNNHYKINDIIRDRMKDHISKIADRDANCKSKSNGKDSLSVSAMYRLFLQDNPDLTPESAKKWLYQDIFNNDFTKDRKRSSSKESPPSPTPPNTYRTSNIQETLWQPNRSCHCIAECVCDSSIPPQNHYKTHSNLNDSLWQSTYVCQCAGECVCVSPTLMVNLGYP